MKTLISLALSLFIAASVTAHADTSMTSAPTQTVTKTKIIYKTVYSCKHQKKYSRKHYSSNRMCAPGYCEYRNSRCSPCGCQRYCYQEHVYQCRTELYYHHGRSYTNVEVCN